MPVSVTSKRDHRRRLARAPGDRGVQPPAAAATRSRTPPCSVNLNAFDSRFFSTCCRRFASVTMLRPSVGSSCDVEREAAALGLVAERCARPSSSRVAKQISSASTVTVPDSIFDRSRMSLIRFSRSVPAPWIVRANSTCFGVRLPSGFSPSCWPRIRMLLSGVRSSCDMLARNSDLYFEVSASSVGLLLERAAGLLDLLVLALDLDVLLGELLRLLRQLLVGLLQLLLLRLQLGGELLRLLRAGPRSASSPRCC